nr:Hsp20/alpha crystallin family protein [Ectobacillus ponti]
MGSTSPQGQAPEAGQRAYQGSASEPSTAPAPALENTPQFPLADIIKKDGKVIVLIDLPGINKEDVQLMMNRNHLVIKGTPKSKVKESDVEIVLYERKHGPFERRILLPEPTDGSNITAKFHNGVLQVSYPIMEQTGEIIPID